MTSKGVPRCPPDHQSRIVHLNRGHSADVEPSWYGESVGHYEGDTLVVDTIGLNGKTWIDQLGTPHTDRLHVVERYRITEGGRTLEANFTVEDPGAFNWPWSGVVRYTRADPSVTKIGEEVCAENNIGFPIPVADVDPVGGRKLSDPLPDPP